MQPDLPWNVAGIPSEAREAARASARREGLSVGEWLTRRILGAMAEGETFETNARSWRAEQAATRESEEMLAHVSRSESDAQNAYRRIEDQLRVLSRRLDATERSQSENGRAMNKAATEISIASREQAQAFDQLGGHVAGLSERLKRVEQHAANDSLRDAVKALHQGLTRLADQISTTANQSASQIAAVAGNVESVAGKLAQARLESENTSHALDARVKRIEDDEAVADIREKVDALAARFDTFETETAAAIAKVEENIARLETRMADSSLGGRVDAVEHAMTDATTRLDHVDRRSAANAAWEESFRALNERLDESEKHRRESADELQAALKEIRDQQAAPSKAEPPAPQAPAPQAPVPQASAPPAPEPQIPEPAPFTPAPAFTPPPESTSQFDLPPFPDQTQAAPQPAAEPFDVPPPPPFETEEAKDLRHEPGESYLAAARRSAREAAAVQAEASPAFNWGFSRREGVAEDEPESKRTRYLLIGGIIVIALLALLAGMMLSRNHHAFKIPPEIGAAFNQPEAAKPAPVKTVPAKPTPAIKPSTTAPETSKPAPVKSVPAKAKPRKAQPAKHAEAKPAPAKPAPKAAPPPKPVSPAERLASLANGGNANAQLLLGLRYLEGKGTPVNEAEAARWFERAADQGDALAEYRLGTLYERGRGVPADAKKAVAWYAAAAKQGNRKAMHNLAVAYAQGSGVKKDYTLAAQWFLKAADLGLADSQFNLAVLYERGMGVPQSLLDAYKWYAVAAAQGDAESRARIDALATQISPADRAAAQHSADTFKPKPLNRTANTPPDISSLPHA